MRLNWWLWTKSAVRWSLLIDATIASLAALLTFIRCPAGLGWVTGMVVPECGLWFATLTFCFAVGAWLLRRGHPIVTTVTITLCTIACLLFLKPTVQAYWIGPRVATQLEAAFGPAMPTRVPFSLRAAIFDGAPEPVNVESLEYSKSLMLDFYRAIGRSPAPCVVVVHGGSWVSGNRMDSGTTRWLNDWMAREGYAVASIDYRLCPEHKWPSQRADLLAAIEFLRAHATKLGIDPQQFVLLGRSAGGQMVTATAYANHDPSICGIIAIYPPTDFYITWKVATVPGNLDHRTNLEWFLGGTPDTAGAAYNSASGALLVNANVPPTLILQGELDINVFHEQGEILAQRLATAHVPHALVSLPWAAHGFDLVSFNSPGGQIEAYAVNWFLKAVTR